MADDLVAAELVCSERAGYEDPIEVREEVAVEDRILEFVDGAAR